MDNKPKILVAFAAASLVLGCQTSIDANAPAASSAAAVRLVRDIVSLALWTNGVAGEDDPGVPATLTFPDDLATSAVGVDVLEGFEQGLVVERSGADLVIEDLLVKDYPIFVRLHG